MPDLVEILTAAEFAHLFVIGILLYRIHTGHRTWSVFGLLGFALSLSLFGPHWAFKALPLPAYVGMIVGFTALVWLAVDGGLRILRMRLLQFLGRISYPLYLIHQAAGFAIIHRLEASGVTANLAVCIAIGVAIGLASAVTYFVEWPARRQLRRLFAAYGNRGAIAVASERPVP